MKPDVPRFCWGGLLLALFLTGGGCERSARPPDIDAGDGKIGAPGMNVLFVSVDTTRADSLGCYGHPVVKTPNVDRLAAEGTRFAQCVSSAPITLPSHATMLTGSYQFVHGARDNGTFVLSEENVTLAEIFKQAGYATRAEVAAVVMNQRYGLDQGFDRYGDVDRRKRIKMGAPNLAPAWARKMERAKEGEEDDEAEPESPELPTPWSLFDRKADEITRCGIELLTEVARGDKPFFMFLHYFDPHQEYAAPERFAQQYKDPYLAEIAFFDEQFGLVMDALRDLGLAEKTLVILTSDHGEGRGQHGEQTHSYFAYDTTLLVPLIIWCPGQVPAGQVVHSQVRLLDLAPTIVDFVRLEPSPQMQGTSLLPLLANPTLDLHLPCYADTLAAQLMFGYSPLRALRDAGWKYILSPAPELYQVAEDPLELINLAKVESDRAAAMRARLREVIAESPPPPGSRAAARALDPEEIRKLQALGYLAGGTADETEAVASGTELDHFEPVGINPRRRIEVIELSNVALGRFLSADYESAEELYSRLLKLEPNNAKATKGLADSLAAQNRSAEAEEQYHRAIKLDPHDVLAHLSLGKLRGLRGDHHGAAEQFRYAVGLDPGYFASHLYLANALSMLKRFEEAFVEYEAAAELDLDFAIIPLRWAIACRAAGRLEEAEAKMRRACELDPEFDLARLHLAHLLVEQDRRAEAIQQLLALLEAHPENIRALEMLASEYTKEGDYKSAEEYFKRAARAEPEGPRAAFNLGLSLALEGKPDEAIVQYRKTLELKPNHARALLELARALEKTKQLDESLQTYERLLKLRPRDPVVYPLAANLLDRQGQAARAIEVLRQGHQLLPDDPEIANDLAWRLATSGQSALREGPEAVRLAELANAGTEGDTAGVLDTLAAAYAEVGRFDEAVTAAKRAAELARQNGETARADRIAARLKLFQNRQPYREP